MRQFSRYKKDKIAHFHKDNGLSLITTIREFNITYKELYKIIKHSRIFNTIEEGGVIKKKCSSCLLFKQLNEDNFYIRKGTKYYYSSCKDCMGLLARTYTIINKKKIYNKRKEYYKQYYKDKKDNILAQKKYYYGKNRLSIIEKKRIIYKNNKRKLFKNFLFKLLK